MSLSVVVPALNEGKTIRSYLSALRAEFRGEILVVDGGSTDNTVEIALEFASKVVHSPRGMANQCNQGAERAGGEFLLFVGSDVYLPAGWPEMVKKTLLLPHVAVGGFSLELDGPGHFYPWISFWSNWRARFFRMALPDQGLFISKSNWRRVGGFRTESRIAFADLCYRAISWGDFVLLPSAARPNVRQWLRGGKWQTTWGHMKIFSAYCLKERWLD